MIDTTTPNSPGWWLARLLKRLVASKADYDLLESYFEGTQAVPVLASKAVTKSYRRLLGMSRTNYAELVTEAVRERLKVVAFRTGADSDLGGDAEAWRIWQANGLDGENAIVHRTAGSMRDAYVIVGPVDPDLGAPVITAEDPRQVVVEYDPIRRRVAIAALKMFRDEKAGADLAYLYLPGYVIRAARSFTGLDNADSLTVNGWDWVGDPQRLPAPVVPVVGFHNSVGIKREAKAEFEPHLSILDRINFQISNRLEIVTLQAFRQRAVKGVPDKDDKGNPIDYDDIFSADPGALWTLPATAEIWESGIVDLTPIHTAVRDDVQDLAAASRTPLFYLTPDAANGSAEGASLAREGLVFKTEDRQVGFGESWEQVMSLAFTLAGDPVRASRVDMETVWAPVERFSLAERYDAASKAAAAGVPWETRMASILQFSPQEIERMRVQRLADALLEPPVAATDMTGG